MRYTENDRAFFLQSADLLAPQLLGKLLCRRLSDGTVLRRRITETEAYCENDSACHSYTGRTGSNAAMFAIGGTAYVFNCHGWQFNVICNEQGVGEGVLIRGVEGCDGPVKLTRALSICKEGVNGMDLLSNTADVWLEEDGFIVRHRRTSERHLGENKSADLIARSRRWRFKMI